jgi:hypothetical protein
VSIQEGIACADEDRPEVRRFAGQGHQPDKDNKRKAHHHLGTPE